MSDPDEHRNGTGGNKLVPGPHGGMLLRVPKGGQSPNPSGQSAVKRLTDALRKRLDEDATLADQIAGWWLKMIESGDSAALREALIRLEGHVPRDAQRELPKITLNVQTVQNSVTGQPVTLPGQPSPALHAVEVEATPVEIAPFVDPDEDGDDE